MKNLVILCVEDEPEVRDALVRDLTPFMEITQVEMAEDVEDARAVVEQCLQDGQTIALVLCDHLLPGTVGVDYLVELSHDVQTSSARKVLVTGQAGLTDTVKAVNNANLDHYIAKPWTRENLQDVVRKQLTDYVIAEVEDLLPYVNLLDGERLLEAVRHRQSDR